VKQRNDQDKQAEDQVNQQGLRSMCYQQGKRENFRPRKLKEPFKDGQ
jgi:hypothetical protein